MLLRIEDTDPARCKPEFEAAIREDLDWLGIVFDAPPRRQSDHLADYAAALARLEALGLVYRCGCARGEIARASAARDPDGAPLHRGRCAGPPPGAPAATRLDMTRARERVSRELTWREYGESARETRIIADPEAWGDVVLRGKTRPAAYHLAVVVDDAGQGVTDVIRGRDLFRSTSLHRLLQALLGLEPPRYRHHRLVLDAEGAKMSKSAASTPLSRLREEGASPADIRVALGFEPGPPAIAASLG